MWELKKFKIDFFSEDLPLRMILLSLVSGKKFRVSNDYVLHVK